MSVLVTVMRHNSAQEPTAGFTSLTRAAAQRQIRYADISVI
ncbi:MAG: hypothetical protein WD646_08970 [Actinomycetota bacterium]